MPWKDSYVDITQIFKISEEDFDKVFDEKDEDFKDEVKNIKNAVREEFQYYVYYLREKLKENSIIFNEFEEKMEHEALILCNSDNEKYYLSMLDKLDYWGQTWELNDNHVLVTMNKYNNQVQKFIDTTSIFKISDADFNNFNKNKTIYLSSNSFSQEDIKKIVNKVNENIKNNLNMSFIEVI